MFGGIVEASASIINSQEKSQLIEITVEKPTDWDDLKRGDSVAVNGICLTVERLREGEATFSLGPETLRVTKWVPRRGEKINLERSLRLGDRVHGHIVNGHVDDIATVVEIVDQPGTRDMTILASENFSRFVWRKGSVAVHGVSLTVNHIAGLAFTVGLIPETLKRTNLGELKVGDKVFLEADAMARAWFHWRRS